MLRYSRFFNTLYLIMPKPTYILPSLPPAANLETSSILRKLVIAHQYLAELKGRVPTIPNSDILIDTLSLQEAMASSEIENIVTTQDELFHADVFPEDSMSPAAKEVMHYRIALKQGYDALQKMQKIISNNTLIDIYRRLKERRDGFRSTPGTVLKNNKGEIVYVPPQDAHEIVRYMEELERFINDGSKCSLDPLIKMAVIHHQFESIHPFSDGNGRVGRILNVLYLIKMGLLDTPILYLSRAIIQKKADYYHLLQAVREQGAWEDWVIYILEAVAETSKTTLQLTESIRNLMSDYKRLIRKDPSTRYSQDLLNNLFRHPYTRIDYMRRDLGVTRQTAVKYLDQLSAAGFVEKRRKGRNNYYINMPLVKLFADNP